MATVDRIRTNLSETEKCLISGEKPTENLPYPAMLCQYEQSSLAAVVCCGLARFHSLGYTRVDSAAPLLQTCSLELDDKISDFQ